MIQTLRRVAVPVALLAALLIGMLAGNALAYQSHMWNAKADLQQSLRQLNMAKSDKAGHRVQAINLVNQAIVQVNLGIQAGR